MSYTVLLSVKHVLDKIVYIFQFLQCQSEALSDPITFVQKLQQKEDLGLPKRQSIASIPTIEWDKYTSKIGSFSWKHKHRTRFKIKKGAEESNSVVSK